MGIKKAIAKRGAVGSTARWAAKGYFAYVQRCPDAELEDVLKFLANARYGSNAKDHEKIIIQMIERHQIRGLAHFVTIILTAEAGFADNTEENKAMFRDVIMEVLEDKSVPPDFIHQVRF